MKSFSKLLVPILFVSCSLTTQKKYFDQQVINKVTKLIDIEPLPYYIGSPPVYIINENDSIAETSFLQLKYAYINLYKSKYSTFELFLNDILNQKIKVDTKNKPAEVICTQLFSLNPQVEKLINQEGIEGVFSKYCKLEAKGQYLLSKNDLSENEISSISYFLFINGYVRLDDDYLPSITFYNFKSLLPSY
jgi:hypothetical protein